MTTPGKDMLSVDGLASDAVMPLDAAPATIAESKSPRPQEKGQKPGSKPPTKAQAAKRPAPQEPAPQTKISKPRPNSTHPGEHRVAPHVEGVVSHPPDVEEKDGTSREGHETNVWEETDCVVFLLARVVDKHLTDIEFGCELVDSSPDGQEGPVSQIYLKLNRQNEVGASGDMPTTIIKKVGDVITSCNEIARLYRSGKKKDAAEKARVLAKGVPERMETIRSRLEVFSSRLGRQGAVSPRTFRRPSLITTAPRASRSVGLLDEDI
jgi:hypothetical protein